MLCVRISCRLTNGCLSQLLSMRVPCAVRHRLRSPRSVVFFIPLPCNEINDHVVSTTHLTYRASVNEIQRPQCTSIKPHVLAEIVRPDGPSTVIRRIGHEAEVLNDSVQRARGCWQ